MLDVYIPIFRPGKFWHWDGSSFIPPLSLRKRFRICKRLRPWWRFGEFSLYRAPGTRSETAMPLAIAKLCPWRQPLIFAARDKFIGFQYLPRAEVEIYHLGAQLQRGRQITFLVFFDWRNDADVLAKRVLICRSGAIRFHVIDTAEWRAVEFATAV